MPPDPSKQPQRPQRCRTADSIESQDTWTGACWKPPRIFLWPQAAILARPCPARGLSGIGVVGPIVFWVPALEVLLYLVIALVPEADQVLGDLHGTACRRKQFEQQRQPACGHGRRLMQPEQL